MEASLELDVQRTNRDKQKKQQQQHQKQPQLEQEGNFIKNNQHQQQQQRLSPDINRLVDCNENGTTTTTTTTTPTTTTSNNSPSNYHLIPSNQIHQSRTVSDVPQLNSTRTPTSLLMDSVALSDSGSSTDPPSLRQHHLPTDGYGARCAQSFSPDDTLNNDFFYDDEFTVPFDANLAERFDGLDGRGLVGSLSCRSVSELDDNDHWQRRQLRAVGSGTRMVESKSDSCLYQAESDEDAEDEEEDRGEMSTSEHYDCGSSFSDISADLCVNQPLFSSHSEPIAEDGELLGGEVSKVADSMLQSCLSGSLGYHNDGESGRGDSGARENSAPRIDCYNWSLNKKQYYLSFDRSPTKTCSSDGSSTQLLASGTSSQTKTTSWARTKTSPTASAAITTPKNIAHHKQNSHGQDHAGDHGSRRRTNSKLTTWRQVKQTNKPPPVGLTTWRQLSVVDPNRCSVKRSRNLAEDRISTKIDSGEAVVTCAAMQQKSIENREQSTALVKIAHECENTAVEKETARREGTSSPKLIRLYQKLKTTQQQQQRRRAVINAADINSLDADRPCNEAMTSQGALEDLSEPWPPICLSGSAGLIPLQHLNGRQVKMHKDHDRLCSDQLRESLPRRSASLAEKKGRSSDEIVPHGECERHHSASRRRGVDRCVQTSLFVFPSRAETANKSLQTSLQEGGTCSLRAGVDQWRTTEEAELSAGLRLRRKDRMLFSASSTLMFKPLPDLSFLRHNFPLRSASSPPPVTSCVAISASEAKNKVLQPSPANCLDDRLQTIRNSSNGPKKNEKDYAAVEKPERSAENVKNLQQKNSANADREVVETINSSASRIKSLPRPKNRDLNEAGSSSTSDSRDSSPRPQQYTTATQSNPSSTRGAREGGGVAGRGDARRRSRSSDSASSLYSACSTSSSSGVDPGGFYSSSSACSVPGGGTSRSSSGILSAGGGTGGRTAMDGPGRFKEFTPINIPSTHRQLTQLTVVPPKPPRLFSVAAEGKAEGQKREIEVRVNSSSLEATDEIIRRAAAMTVNLQSKDSAGRGGEKQDYSWTMTTSHPSYPPRAPPVSAEHSVAPTTTSALRAGEQNAVVKEIEEDGGALKEVQYLQVSPTRSRKVRSTPSGVTACTRPKGSNGVDNARLGKQTGQSGRPVQEKASKTSVSRSPTKSPPSSVKSPSTSPRQQKRTTASSGGQSRSLPHPPAAASAPTKTVGTTVTIVGVDTGVGGPAKSILRRRQKTPVQPSKHRSWSEPPPIETAPETSDLTGSGDTKCPLAFPPPPPSPPRSAASTPEGTPRNEPEIISPGCSTGRPRHADGKLSRQSWHSLDGCPDTKNGQTAAILERAASFAAEEEGNDGEGVRDEVRREDHEEGEESVRDYERFRAKKSVSFSEKIFYHSSPVVSSPLESPNWSHSPPRGESASGGFGGVATTPIEGGRAVRRAMSQSEPDDISEFMDMKKLVATVTVDDQEMPPSDFMVSPNTSPLSSLSTSSESTFVDIVHKRELVLDVMRAVEILLKYFGQTRDHSARVKLGSTQESKDVGRLVLEHLCPAIHAIILDGLKPHVHSLFGKVKNSAWKLVEDSAEMGQSVDIVQQLLRSLKSLKFLNTPWLLFNAFIFGLLNYKAVDFWLTYVHTHRALIARHYTSSAFLALSSTTTRRLFLDLITSLQPLAQMPLRLEYNFERRLLEQRHQEQLAEYLLDQHVSRSIDAYVEGQQAIAQWQNLSVLNTMGGGDSPPPAFFSSAGGGSGSGSGSSLTGSTSAGAEVKRRTKELLMSTQRLLREKHEQFKSGGRAEDGVGEDVGGVGGGMMRNMLSTLTSTSRRRPPRPLSLPGNLILSEALEGGTGLRRMSAADAGESPCSRGADDVTPTNDVVATRRARPQAVLIESVGSEDDNGSSTSITGLWEQLARQIKDVASVKERVYRKNATHYSFERSSGGTAACQAAEGVGDTSAAHSSHLLKDSVQNVFPNSSTVIGRHEGHPVVATDESLDSADDVRARRVIVEHRTLQHNPADKHSGKNRWSDFGTHLIHWVDKLLLTDTGAGNRGQRSGMTKCSSEAEVCHVGEAPGISVGAGVKSDTIGRAVSLYDLTRQGVEQARASGSEVISNGVRAEVKGHTMGSLAACGAIHEDPSTSRFVSALCHYVAMDSEQLSFQKGTVFVVLKDLDADWLLCRHGDSEGIVHVGCVGPVDRPPQACAV